MSKLGARGRVIATTATVLALGVILAPPPASADGAASPEPSPSPAVIGYDDSGINPYHEEFRAPTWTDHPSTYIDDYPETAEPLNLTLDADTFDDAWNADQDTWNSLDTDQLYYIPGTRIVGVIDGEIEFINDPAPTYDHDGHGTAVASAGSGNTLGTHPGSAIVMTSGMNGRAWFAANAWVDVASLSYGNLAGIGAPSLAQATYEMTDQGRSVFTAGGNGPVVSGPTTLLGSYRGPPWTVTVGLYEEASAGLPSYRTCADCSRPVEVLGQTGVQTANTDSLDATERRGGTSIATPRVAGHAAHLIDQARERLDDTSHPGLDDDTAYANADPTTPLPTQGPLADGTFTRADLERLIRQPSIPVPWAIPNTDDTGILSAQTPSRNLSQPTQARYTWQGYGAHNHTANQQATQILHGDAPWPTRSTDDSWHAFWQATRTAYWHTAFCQYDDFNEAYDGNCWTDPTLDLADVTVRHLQQTTR